MVSRVCLAALLAVLAGAAPTASAGSSPPTGTAMFVVRHDLRLCPSPRCGGYWITIANGARTRCTDERRRTECYAAVAVDRRGHTLGRLADGSLVRGVLRSGQADLGRLVVHAVYAPAGSAPAAGGFYRVFDNGIRCVRAPCFSTTARSVNAATRVTASSVDLGASRASASDIRRADAALTTKDGLYARGQFARTPDGGRVFRALRLYLRATLPRA